MISAAIFRMDEGRNQLRKLADTKMAAIPNRGELVRVGRRYIAVDRIIHLSGEQPSIAVIGEERDETFWVAGSRDLLEF